MSPHQTHQSFLTLVTFTFLGSNVVMGMGRFLQNLEKTATTFPVVREAVVSCYELTLGADDHASLARGRFLVKSLPVSEVRAQVQKEC